MKYEFKIKTHLRGEDCVCTVWFWPGTPNQTSGPPERCHEGDPADLEIMSCLVDGQEADMTEQEADDLQDRLAELCIDRLSDESAAAQEAYEADQDYWRSHP